MIYRGHFKNGAIVLDEQVDVPDGIKVRIELLSSDSSDGLDTAEGTTLYERMKAFVGTAKNLPPDASSHVDHYLYGHPKQ